MVDDSNNNIIDLTKRYRYQYFALEAKVSVTDTDRIGHPWGDCVEAGTA